MSHISASYCIALHLLASFLMLFSEESFRICIVIKFPTGLCCSPLRLTGSRGRGQGTGDDAPPELT